MNIGKIKNIKLTNKTAYLAGVIIGDGHISNSTKSKKDKSKDYKIVIDLADKEYLIFLSDLIKSIIKTKSVPKPSVIKGNRKERLYFQFRNKSFYYFLTKDLRIPSGKKSSIVRIPGKIFQSSLEIKKYFIAGLFDTDGGIRGSTIGFTSASEILINEVSELLNEFLIDHSTEKWRNKKYNREYYGIRISRIKIDKFLKSFPFNNKEKLTTICFRRNAEMPEWSNGIDG